MEEYSGKACGCKHHKVVPLLITLFGLAFLLEAMGWIRYDFFNLLWPVLIILGGLTMLFGSRCGCCNRHM